MFGQADAELVSGQALDTSEKFCTQQKSTGTQCDTIGRAAASDSTGRVWLIVQRLKP